MRGLVVLFSLLSKRERRIGWVVFVLILGTAVLEALGVASVMPFLAVLANPKAVEEQAALNWLYHLLPVTDVQAFLVWVGGMVFAVIVVTALARTVTLYAVNRYVQMRRYTLSRRLLATYLEQPYEFFLNRHSGDMSARVLSEVDVLVNSVLQPVLQGLASMVLIVAVVVLLLVVNPFVAIAVALIIGGAYALTYYLIRHLLSRQGRERSEANKDRFHAASEAMAGIKPIKLSGAEESYLRAYERPARTFSRLQASESTLSQVPRHVIEAIGIGGVIVLAMILISTTGDIGQTLPMLGLYAFAGYRLLPAAQNTYSAMARLRFGGAAIDRVKSDLMRTTECKGDGSKPLTFAERIQLDVVAYRHPGAPEAALSDVSLSIPKGACIGIVGETGAGKSTLIDLVLGLLEPTQGDVRVDDTVVTRENRRAWQSHVGYVPQDIFLLDASIRENIALGVPVGEIDDTTVENCARKARLHDFVMESLPEGYDTYVGERGVRLSGGQRQRIGLARALYSNPQVLVLDEATSALDNRTENLVMESVGALHGDVTVLMVAHRLSTLDHCDTIVWLEGGRVREIGNRTLLSRISQRADNG